MAVECNRCGKSFPSDWHLRRHLTRKTPCTVNRAEVPILDNTSPENSTGERFECAYCHGTFSRQWVLNRHLAEGRCKVLKSRAAKNAPPKDDRVAELEAELAALKVAASAGPSGNTTINNITQINNTVNVMINPKDDWRPPNDFGHENEDYLTPLRLQNMFKQIPSSLANEDACVAMMYLVLTDMMANADHPENLTAIQPSGSRKEALVVINGCWMPMPLKAIADVLQKRGIQKIKDAPAAFPADYDFIAQLDAVAATGEFFAPIKATLERAYTEVLERSGHAPSRGEKTKKVPPPAPPDPADLGIAIPAPRRIARSAVDNIRNMARLKHQALTE